MSAAEEKLSELVSLGSLFQSLSFFIGTISNQDEERKVRQVMREVGGLLVKESSVFLEMKKNPPTNDEVDAKMVAACKLKGLSEKAEVKKAGRPKKAEDNKTQVMLKKHLDKAEKDADMLVEKALTPDPTRPARKISDIAKESKASDDIFPNGY